MNKSTSEFDAAPGTDPKHPDGSRHRWITQFLIIGSVAPVTIFLLTLIEPRFRDAKLNNRDRQIVRAYLNRPESAYGWGWSLAAFPVQSGTLPELAPDCTVIRVQSRMLPWMSLLQSRSKTRFHSFLFIKPDGSCREFPPISNRADYQEFFDWVEFHIRDETSLDVLTAAFREVQSGISRSVTSRPKRRVAQNEWLLHCDPDTDACWLKVSVDDTGRILRVEYGSF